MQSNARLRLALRALLIALWAFAATIAPAHAAMDAFDDPCQQTSASVLDQDDLADVDLDFHAAHDCGTCHAHALLSGAPPAAKPALSPAPRVFANIEAASGERVTGPYRPPQA